jgi:hypothetical protein
MHVVMKTILLSHCLLVARSAAAIGVSCLALGACLTLGSSPAVASVVFSDTVFALANYTVVADPNDTESFTYQQCASCGDTGQALSITQAYDGTGPTMSGGAIFLNTAFTYNPATLGAIGSIDVSVNKLLAINYAGTFTSTFKLVIQQGGNDYVDSISAPSLTFGAGGGSSGWTSIAASGLVASNFTLFNPATFTSGTGNPNFGGGAMTFGLLSLGTWSGVSSTTSISVAFDNLAVDINPVPEPASLGLFGFGLGALAWLRRRTGDRVVLAA